MKTGRGEGPNCGAYFLPRSSFFFNLQAYGAHAFRRGFRRALGGEVEYLALRSILKKDQEKAAVAALPAMRRTVHTREGKLRWCQQRDAELFGNSQTDVVRDPGKFRIRSSELDSERIREL